MRCLLIYDSTHNTVLHGFVELPAITLAAAFTSPYVYYVALRWVCFTACGLSFAYLWHRLKDKAGFLFLAFAALFNPFLPFHFSRDAWQAVDALSALSLTVTTLHCFLDSKEAK